MSYISCVSLRLLVHWYEEQAQEHALLQKSTTRLGTLPLNEKKEAPEAWGIRAPLAANCATPVLGQDHAAHEVARPDSVHHVKEDGEKEKTE